MALDKNLLHYFVRDALAPYSENFNVLERNNPTILQLNGKTYSVHVSYVHDSGNMRDNPDEDRIQIQRKIIEGQGKSQAEGIEVAFIGFFDGGKTFVAWEPRYVFSQNPKKGGSVYARRSHADLALEQFAAAREIKARNLGEVTLAIALPSTALGFYLENIEHFHRLPNEASIVNLMKSHSSTFTDGGIGTGGEIDVEENEQREKFTYERKAYPRDPHFKKWIMDAYEQTCCVCNRQLGLIQAAHIIPHSVEDSPNIVQNGLAMCIEHHHLYDDALLLPGPDQRLVFNDERAEYLRQTNQDKGLDGIAALAKQQYQIPNDAELRPSDDFLQRGLEIRLGR
jgi:putative restriction endonuclease